MEKLIKKLREFDKQGLSLGEALKKLEEERGGEAKTLIDGFIKDIGEKDSDKGNHVAKLDTLDA